MSAERTDNTSLVPHYSFPETLAEQEVALEANPLLQRLHAYRKRYEGDLHRPIYHYVNPENTLNDPNGLSFWQDRWHLFYQSYPPEDPRQHWGHAISDDLIHWQDLPYAIYPSPEECCFSGATLVEEDRVIAIYHGTKVGNMVAVSHDPLLLNWEKLTGAPVIPIASEDGSPLPYRVFDPCIWKKGDHYYALSGGTLPHEASGKRTRANFLFRSPNLVDWDYLHPFVEDDIFTLAGDDGACPYFWPIGDRHILLFYSHMSGGQALLGDYDTERDKFVVTSHHDFNFGASGPGGVHAPSATPDGKGGVTVIFNMNPAKPTEDWNQIMTLPRRLTLQGTDAIGRDTLLVEPAGDIESLRGEHRQITDMVLPANQEIVLGSIRGNAVELIAEIETNDAPLVELNVLRSPGKEEYTRIAFYRERGFRDWERFEGAQQARLTAATTSRSSTGSSSFPVYDPQGLSVAATDGLISIDSAYASLSPDVRSRAPETGPVFLERDEPLRLRVFVDRSVVEVFANGRQCVAMRVYPEREDSVGVSLRSQGQDARVVSLEAWQMKNIYE
ncbi:MAG: glycoside hydrolase family 32 protein [Caldilineaceae bacterium]|nr:glycoside hydrolase family 32 protein [Caldilineaceae bacterium]MDE0340478.1 glycoside hydrolase family 32 protein [Caldilineaceae bacterium]